jgi:hypothetical protein
LIVSEGEEGTVQKLGEDEGGGALSLPFLGALAAGEADERLAGGGVSGEGVDEGLDVG